LNAETGEISPDRGNSCDQDTGQNRRAHVIDEMSFRVRGIKFRRKWFLATSLPGLGGAQVLLGRLHGRGILGPA
jgi:hypothetical protein